MGDNGCFILLLRSRAELDNQKIFKNKYYMFYYLYQTTNMVNHKIYIGVHMTSDINDGYMGSGKLLRRAIKKYGVENFKKEILEYFDSLEEMFIVEAQIVTNEFVSRKDTYNLKVGGAGGFDYINKNGLNGFKTNKDLAIMGRRLANKVLEKKYGKNWRSTLAKLASDKGKQPFKEKWLNDANYRASTLLNLQKGKIFALSEESKEKRRNTFRKTNHQQGSKNSQYGKVWIYNLDFKLSKPIKVEELEIYLNLGWIKGRKLKFN